MIPILNQKKRSINKAYSDLITFLLLVFLPTQFGKHFFFDFSYLSGIRVDYLAPTAYLTDILVFLLVILNLKTALSFFKQRKVIAVVLLLLVAVFISLSPAVSIYRYVKILELLAVFSFARRCAKNTAVFFGLTISAIVEFALSTLQFIYKHAVGGLFYFLGERYLTLSTPGIAKGSLGGVEILRPYGTFSHPNSMAGFYLMIYFFFLTDSRFSRKPLLKNITLFFSTMLIFLSFSKIAIVIFFFFNVFYALMRNRQAFCRICVISRAATMLILAFLFLQLKGDAFSFEKRVVFMRNALAIIMKFPVFGTGLGTFIVAQNQLPSRFFDMINQPVHNIFLLFLSETGLIVGSIIIFMIFVFIKRSKKNLFILGVFVLTGFFDHYWITLQQNALLLAFIAGLTLSVSRRSAEGSG